MIFQLVYRSTASQEFWPNDLFALVEKARTKNAARGITGMLLFHKNQFLQLLEGSEAAVRACFEVLRRDARHRDIKVLLTDEVQERCFPEWTMGFERISDAWSLPRAWSTVLEDEPILPGGDNTAAKDLLLSFRHLAPENG